MDPSTHKRPNIFYNNVFLPVVFYNCAILIDVECICTSKKVWGKKQNDKVFLYQLLTVISRSQNTVSD